MRVMLLSVAVFLSGHLFAFDAVVAKDGSGNYLTVQAAIDAAPSGRTTPYIIYIKNGRYREKITVPSSKPFLQLVGESVANTILTYDDYAGKYLSCSATLGTQNSAGFSINAADFAATNISFENSYGDGSQAVTVLVNADRAVFTNCRFLGNQDTLYLKGTGTPRCYFKACYIDGNVDFVFGNSIALFDSCVLYAKTRPATTSSFITAPNTPTGQAYGFVFRDCKLPANTGTTSYFLSRPWPSPSEAATAQKTVFINTLMGGHINPAGWTTWNASTITGNLLYAEYNSRFFNQTPVDVSARVPWSAQLTATEAATYTFANVLGSWNPCINFPGVCDGVPAPLAISNFKVDKGASSSTISWNISWPVAGASYVLYRSADNVNFAPVYSITAATDTAVNFAYTDPSVPASGSAYYYYVSVSKQGLATHNTETNAASNAPSLTINAPAALSLCGFNQVLGTPSPVQSYTLAGSNLTGNVLIQAPDPFEVSADGITWYSSTSALTITPTNGVVATSTISVRLNASAVGNYSGVISNSAAGVASIEVAVKGRTTPVSTSTLLQAWALTSGTNDSVQVRSPAVLASVASLFNLNVTDGTLPLPTNTVPAYSNNFGQALGANAAGNNWQNVGGILRRNYYEQFTVTATSGNSVRIDSITFRSNFYGTASGTKMSLVYSKNAFGSPADSTEFSDGINGSGTVLTLTPSGSFAKSFPIAQSNAGPIDYYSLALNSSDGVTINSGEALTFRLYWACSSTGTPRFALLKDVQVKGVVLNPVPVNLLYFNAVFIDGRVRLSWQTDNEYNLSRYEIERSEDGVHFVAISSVAAFNTAGLRLYQSYDSKAGSGTVYYRLKMKSTDGSFLYSNVNAVLIRRPDGLRVVPNVVAGSINVFHAKAKVGDKIEIYSFDGRRMLQQALSKDAVQTNISAGNLVAGAYNLVLVNGERLEFVKFIKQ